MFVWTLLKKQQFSSFKVLNLVLKNANFLHKQGFDDSQLSPTVGQTVAELLAVKVGDQKKVLPSDWCN